MAKKRKSFDEDLAVSMKEAFTNGQGIVMVEVKDLVMEDNVRHADLFGDDYDPYNIENYNPADIEKMRLSYQANIDANRSLNDQAIQIWYNENGKPVVQTGNSRSITAIVHFPDASLKAEVLDAPLNQSLRRRENTHRAEQSFLSVGIGYNIELKQGRKITDIAKEETITTAEVKKLASLVALGKLARGLCRDKVLLQPAAIELATYSKAEQRRVCEYIKSNGIKIVKTAKALREAISRSNYKIDDVLLSVGKDGFEWKKKTYPKLEEEPWYHFLGDEDLYKQHVYTDEKKYTIRKKAVEEYALHLAQEEYGETLIYPDKDSYGFYSTHDRFNRYGVYQEVPRGTHPEEQYVYWDHGVVKIFLKTSLMKKFDKKEKEKDSRAGEKVLKIKAEHERLAFQKAYVDKVRGTDLHIRMMKADLLDRISWQFSAKLREKLYKYANQQIKENKTCDDNFYSSISNLALIPSVDLDALTEEFYTAYMTQKSNHAIKMRLDAAKVDVKPFIKQTESEYKERIKSEKDKRKTKKEKEAEKHQKMLDSVHFHTVTRQAFDKHAIMMDKLWEDENTFLEKVYELREKARQELFKFIKKHLLRPKKGENERLWLRKAFRHRKYYIATYPKNKSFSTENAKPLEEAIKEAKKQYADSYFKLRHKVMVRLLALTQTLNGLMKSQPAETERTEAMPDFALMIREAFGKRYEGVDEVKKEDKPFEDLMIKNPRTGHLSDWKQQYQKAELFDPEWAALVCDYYVM